MATWIKKKQYTPWSAYQRVSLKNGDIPGRKAKTYRVSFYRFNEIPHSDVTTFTDDRPPISGVTSRRGIDIGIGIDESTDVVWTPGALASELIDEATSKVHSKAQKARDDDFNGAVFLAEMPSVVKMFANTAGRVVNAYHAVTRGDLQRARKALGVTRGGQPGKASANNWLELKFGWAPLLDDIYNGAKKLANVLHDPTRSWTVKGNATRTVKETHLLESFVSAYFPNPGTYIKTEELSAQMGVRFTVQNEMIVHAAATGFTNPMNIAWQTLPSSFVLDWIVDVGGWLRQFSSFHGMQFVDGWVTVKGKTTVMCAYPGGSFTTYKYHSEYNGAGELVYIQDVDYVFTRTGSQIVSETSGMRRDPMSEFPSPVLPRFNPRLNWDKLVTVVAMARQRV